jgi:predicted nucleotidyltransferase
MTRSEVIRFLKENKEFFKKNYKVNRIGLFGSYARNENTEDSDIDIIVDMPSSFDSFFDLKEFLEDGLNSKIDLGLEKTLRQLIKNQIKNEIIYV